MKQKTNTISRAARWLVTLLAVINCATVVAQSTDPIVTGYTHTSGTAGNKGETSSMLVDGDMTTKWCVSHFTPSASNPIFIEFNSAEAFIPTGYVLTTGGDAGTSKGRNPKSWVIKAKLNYDDAWTTIATVTNDGVLQDVNTTDYEFTIDNNKVYKFFRFEVTAIKGGTTHTFQLTEFQFRGYRQLVTLSGSQNYTAQDGNILTGSTWGTLTIADGASVTLRDVTIEGGIVCAGTATITLEGTNSVTGANQKAGIQVGAPGTTLTIRGDGALTATGGSSSAGIGLSKAWEVDVSGGDIVIEGGTITAIGDYMGAGIGTGAAYKGSVTLGDITIKGGTVTANRGDDTDAYGIGAGFIYYNASLSIGSLRIYDTIDKVDASSFSKGITYMHGEDDVTANASDYFSIMVGGSRRIIAPKDDTDYTINIASGIEHGTISCAATAKYLDKVTITATPTLGCRLVSLTVKDAQNNEVEISDNSFFMPNCNVTISAAFEQGVHGTTEFKWFHYKEEYDEEKESIYDGVTTVNIQKETSYYIRKYHNSYDYNSFRSEDYSYETYIPCAGVTGTISDYSESYFRLDYHGEEGFYDITMTDLGNDRWSVSIQKTVPVVDNIPDQNYTGSAITPEPLVLIGSLNIAKGTDYDYSYEANTNVGTAKVIVTFKGTYASFGSVEKTFNIRMASSDEDKILTDDMAYTQTCYLNVPSATYSKTIGTEQVGKYQAWLVPFDYTITETDLQKFSFYKINMIANAPSGSGNATDQAMVLLTKFSAGAVLRANTPYVYKPLKAVTNYAFTAESATLKTMNTDVVLKTETAEDIYSFYATYDNTTATAAAPFYYVDGDGIVSYGNDATVNPYRWVIRKTDKNGDTPATAPQMRFIDGEGLTIGVRGDANGDGSVSVTDIGVIVDIILGINNNNNAGSRKLQQQVEPQ